MSLPVDDATGLHMCVRVRVTEPGLDRSGEVGIVVKATSLRVHVRFAAELLPSGEMARPRVQLNRYMTSRCSVLRCICVQSGRVQMEYGGGDKYELQ